MPKEERVGVNDTLGFVLTKADGTVIDNKPVKITEELLREIGQSSK